MHIDDPIGWHLRVLVAVVVNEILAADEVEVGAKRPGVGDGVFGPGLKALRRQAGDMISGKDLDVAGGVRDRLLGDCSTIAVW